jgi:hypothetical protein
MLLQRNQLVLSQKPVRFIKKLSLLVENLLLHLGNQLKLQRRQFPHLKKAENY